MEASKRNPLDLRSGGNTPLDYPALALLAGRLGRRHREDRSRARRCGRQPARRSPAATWSPSCAPSAAATAPSRATSTSPPSAVFALKAAGAPDSELARSGRWLRSAQNNDGGWGLKPDQPSTPDSTGSALQALALAGRGSAMGKGVGFLRGAQSSDGGWALYGGGTNSQSTAWGVQGMVAAGGNPAGVTSGGQLAARLHRRAPGRRRPLPLLGLVRPDADLGDQPGADGDRAPAVPDDRGAAHLSSPAGCRHRSAAGPAGPRRARPRQGTAPGEEAQGQEEEAAAKADAKVDADAVKEAAGERTARPRLGSRDRPARLRRRRRPQPGGLDRRSCSAASALALGGGFLWYRRRFD